MQVNIYKYLQSIHALTSFYLALCDLGRLLVAEEIIPL